MRDAPTFADLWPTLRAWIDDAEFLAAHNALFDQNVLFACCTRYRLRAPRTPFTCTVQLARAQWGIYPTKLPDVCRQLRIPLRHHDSGSDAEACARIVLAAVPGDGVGVAVPNPFANPIDGVVIVVQALIPPRQLVPASGNVRFYVPQHLTEPFVEMVPSFCLM